MDAQFIENLDKWKKITWLIGQSPENEWDLEVASRYVRALNNSGKFEKAVEVALRHETLGENDALWQYRLGYAYTHLNRSDEAKAVLLRGKALAAGDRQPYFEIMGDPVSDAIDDPNFFGIKIADDLKNPAAALRLVEDTEKAILKQTIEKFKGRYRFN